MIPDRDQLNDNCNDNCNNIDSDNIILLEIDKTNKETILDLDQD